MSSMDTPTPQGTTTSVRNPGDNAVLESDQIETAKWTRHLPEAFGIRKAVQQSKYRWCVRESALWGIATGTTMYFHRFRMKSKFRTAVNASFLTFTVVYFGSYYFCYKKRDFQEQMIEHMMRLNTFEPASDMPAEIPMDENHPFVIDRDEWNNNDGSGGTNRAIPATRQYVAKLPERKPWQKPIPTQDVADIFKPVDDDIQRK